MVTAIRMPASFEDSRLSHRLIAFRGLAALAEYAAPSASTTGRKVPSAGADNTSGGLKVLHHSHGEDNVE